MPFPLLPAPSPPNTLDTLVCILSDISVLTTCEGLFCPLCSRPTFPLALPLQGTGGGQGNSLSGGPLSEVLLAAALVSGQAPVWWLPLSGFQNRLLPLPFHPGTVYRPLGASSSLADFLTPSEETLLLNSLAVTHLRFCRPWAGGTCIL